MDINILIKQHYRKLLKACPAFDPMGRTLLRKAFLLMLETHRDKTRENGEPFFIHAIEIASILSSEMGMGKTSVIGGLLQEIALDNPDMITRVKDDFGNDMAIIVTGLTQIGQLQTEKMATQPESFIRLLLTLAADVRVVLIRLADRLHYMRTIGMLPLHLKQKVAYETESLYAPIAHRLGLYKIKTELEERSMEFLYSAAYHSIKKKLQENKEEQTRYLDEFIAPIRQLLLDNNFDFEIKGRSKSIHSIWKKMKKQRVPFEQVYDLYAIRIILNIPQANEQVDLWKVYSLITNKYTPNPKRLRDWISVPKPNGYESLHTTVEGADNRWIEIQIRSRRMDVDAEKGQAAHWRYKQGKVQEGADEWLKNIRDILESPDPETLLHQGNPNQRLHEIFVFTPNGDLKKIPAGGTILDFAFSIHSSVGAQCTGGRVNGKQVQIKHELKNGDRVEVFTSKSQRPNLDWLNWVRSVRTKTKIKRLIKDAQYDKAELGKEILKRKFAALKQPFSDEIITAMVGFFESRSPIDLYQMIGEERISLPALKDFVMRFNQPVDIKKRAPSAQIIQKQIEQPQGKEDFILIGEHSDLSYYKFAKCCQPAMGDDIFGFITVNEGIKIHQLHCPNASELRRRYPYRIINARWVADEENKGVVAMIKMQGNDMPGVLNNVTQVISTDMKVNIRSIAFDSDKNKFLGNIEVFIRDKSHLNTLVRKIAKIKGIVKVTTVINSI